MLVSTQTECLTPSTVTAPIARSERVRRLVTEILAANGIRAPFSDDATLAEVGLASLDMVKLMLAVENEFTIEIPQADITPETFRSVATIEQLVARLTASAP